MSRLTGNDAYGLMEAYNAVYAPQELTEEQVWEEVEVWVNSLVEEGYDLSEYTWEDMYEAYLNEGGPGARASVPASATGKYKSSSDGKYYRNYNDALAARNSRLNTLRSAQDMLKGKPSSLGATPAERARPPVSARPAASAPAPRPAAPAASVRPSARPASPVSAARPAAATPTAAKPTLGTTGKPLVGGIERRTPTSAELKAAQAARSAATSAKTPTPTPTPAATQTPAAAPTSTPAAKPAPTNFARTRSQVLGQSFDPFDVVIGHLLDEGYADTEEAALAIMANMSEDWREGILVDEGLMDVAGKVAGDIKNRLTGKKELVGGPQGYIKVGGPSKPGDVRVSGIGPVGTYGRKYTPQSGDRPITSSIRR